MRLLVTGASGLLGSAVLKSAQNSGWEVFGTFLSNQVAGKNIFQMDITNRNDVEKILQSVRADAVIHTAANSNMDWCEENKEQAYRINAEGTLNIAEACKRSNSFLIYISTDYVFDGKSGPYKEGDEPSPLMYYGTTKLKGEEFVRETLDKFCIARTSMQFGWGGTKENFATYIVNQLRKGAEVQAIKDYAVSPSYSPNMADMLLEIAERKLSGVMHVSGATRATRYEFAIKVAEVFGLDKNLITGITPDELRWKTSRPRNGGLVVSSAEKTLRNKPLRLEDSLRRMRDDEKSLKALSTK